MGTLERDYAELKQELEKYQKLNPSKLNDALWAACNTRFTEPAPSLEDVSQAAYNAIICYLGIEEE